jgi:hypothetical protein
MGGKYPKGRSWNFWGSKPALAAHVLDTWDGPITFLGDTVGKTVLIGGPLMASNLKDDPIRMAYKYYGFGDPLPSWDPLVNVPPHFHREVYADFFYPHADGFLCCKWPRGHVRGRRRLWL